MEMVLAKGLQLRSGLVLPNRFAKAAMTESLARRDDEPNEAHCRLYERWSRGGAGLLITGNVMVDRRFLERVGNVVFDSSTDVAAVRAWARASTCGGSGALVQLSHPGRQTNRFVTATPVAPSAGDAVDQLHAFNKPRALEAGEIEQIIERFADAAILAQTAGFDGVQIHAAHGYLISQFLSPLTNQRADRWGGSLHNRAQFLIDVVRAVRSRTGEAFTVAVKLNSADFQRGGFTHEDSMEVVRMLDRESVDLLEVSGGNYESPAFLTRGVADSTRAREAYFLEYAREARAHTSTPIMLTGGLRSMATMVSAIEDGAMDVAGLARPLVVEPDLPQRLLDGSAESAIASGPRRVPHRTLDTASEAAWYGMQMHRMSEGLDPDPNLGPWRPLLRYFARDMGGGMARRWFGRS